jgi:NADH:ubiquinone reductase (H+-translocating)
MRKKRRRMLTFVVAGAGFTGIEMIGELLEYRDAMCKKYFIKRTDTRVINIEALPSILPILEEPLRVRAEQYLEKMGCEVMLNASIIGAEPGKVLCKDGVVIETDTFIWTCGVKGSSFAAGLELAKGERGRGRLQVDAEMKSPDYPYAYVVGDNAFYLENGKPVPQIVEGAHQTAEVAAKNIIADITGDAHRHQFKSNFHGFMVSIGGRFAVANAGGMQTKGFFAMVMKHMINLYYLFNIAGVNQMWEYGKHEFLDMRDNRSIVGGFLYLEGPLLLAPAPAHVAWCHVVLRRLQQGRRGLAQVECRLQEQLDVQPWREAGYLGQGRRRRRGRCCSQRRVGRRCNRSSEAATSAASGDWAEPAAEAVAAARTP